jgi:4-hydroxybenzoate polyprenyltransferase
VLQQLSHAVRALRPKQWTKNGIIVFAAVFAHRATDLPTVGRITLAFFAFSFAASTIYIVNDIADRNKDRLHPTKRERPIASGKLSLSLAVVTAVLTFATAIVLCVLLTTLAGTLLAPQYADPFAPWGGGAMLFGAALGVYVLLNLAYSIWLKHQVLWDVFVIAAGFVLRALAGAFAAAVIISPWFYLCALFSALFLALGKRRAEFVSVAVEEKRASLRQYSVQLLDQLMTVVVVCTLMTYSLYTFQNVDSGNHLMITIPVVIFGVFRYLYLIYVKGEGEAPDVLLLRDKQILVAVAVCLLLVAAILYGNSLAVGVSSLLASMG